MKPIAPPNLSRLHNLRMENTASGYAMQELAPRFEQLKKRHANGTAPRAVSSFQLFQTPEGLAQRMVALAGANATRCVLEPSAGLGRILDALKPCSPAEVVAVEMASQCAAELYRRQDVRLYQRDFLTVEPAELGQFDAVIMNPPFHMRADIRHILHAQKFLLPGGILVALCLDTHHRDKALQPLALSWEKIPAGAFKESNTGVATVLLTIQA